jgi:LmbE family N-acetylglucosaminyl deacetylase
MGRDQALPGVGMSVGAAEGMTEPPAPIAGRIGEHVRRALDSVRSSPVRRMWSRTRQRTLPPSIEVDTPVLVVSPHLDDAVLSAFAFLQRRHTTVLTVFTGSPRPDEASDWDRGLGHDDAVEIMRIRLAEDERAFASLPVDTIRMALLENGYRSAPMPQHDIDAMREAVRAWIEAAQGRGVVLVPAGAGAVDNFVYRRRWNTTAPLLRVPGGGLPHPDHLAVRDEVIDEALTNGARVVLYEELPYRWTGRGDRAVERVAARVGCTATRFQVDVDQDAKAAGVTCYASQLPGLFRPWVHDVRAVMPSYERFWTLERGES